MNNRHFELFYRSVIRICIKWCAQKEVDVDGKVRWINSCNRFCSVLPEGGHVGATSHSHAKD